MATIHNSAAFSNELSVAVSRKVDGAFAQYAQMHPKLFRVQDSKLYRETIAVDGGLATLQAKNKGASISYDAGREIGSVNLTHITYALGFKIEEELLEDSLFGIGARYGQHLGRSARNAMEVVHSNILNRAFNASYTGADASALCVSTHALADASNESNILATAADLSHGSLETALTTLRQTNDDRGMPILLTPKYLVVAPNEEFNAKTILTSIGEAGTANNDINVLRGGLELVVWDHLTDTDAWFIVCEEADLVSYLRVPFSVSSGLDFDTGDFKTKGRVRFACGWGEWRGVFGTPGAA